MATVNASGQPNTTCMIAFRAVTGTNISAPGLFPKSTDSTGKVTWTWTIGAGLSVGTATVTVTCGGATGSSPIVIHP